MKGFELDPEMAEALKRSEHSPEAIVGRLKNAQKLLANVASQLEVLAASMPQSGVELSLFDSYFMSCAVLDLQHTMLNLATLQLRFEAAVQAETSG